MKRCVEFKKNLFHKVYSQNPITLTLLAKRLGRSKVRIYEWYQGISEPSVKHLIEIERALGITETDFLEHITTTSIDEMFVQGFPYRALVSRGFLNENSPLPKHEQLLRFFQLGSISAFEKAYLSSKISSWPLDFSNSSFYKVHAAWYRAGELLSKKNKEDEFSKENLQNLRNDIITTAYRKEENFFSIVQGLCEKAGISLVKFQRFPQADVGAIGTFHENQPVLICSEKYVQVGDFLQMLFEALEFFEHRDSNFFVKDIVGLKEKEERKKKAQYKLLPEASECEILSVGEFSEKSIRYFASTMRVPEYIIARRLYKLGFISPSLYMRRAEPKMIW